MRPPSPQQPSWRRSAAVLVAASAGLAVALTGCSAPTPEPAEELQVGVSLPSYHYDVSAVEDWEATVGHRADVLQTFVAWRYTDEPGLSDFPTYRAEEIEAGRRTVEITWEPAVNGDDDDEPELTLDSIAYGKHDDYVRSFAEAVRDSGVDVRIRLGHEMNGSWSAFSEVSGTNDPGDFARAWRHVHDVFADVGATDVTWVWSPNVVGQQTTPLERLYPGDAFVDVVGIDGYAYPRDGCRPVADLFDETLRQVRAITDRPVVLAEVGVATTCEDRAEWITDLFAWVGENDVRGVTWWERDTDRDDYRIAEDPAALKAYRAAVDR